jgi:hypothetical protein
MAKGNSRSQQVEAAKQRLTNAQTMKKVIGGREAAKELDAATAQLQAVTGLGWK